MSEIISDYDPNSIGVYVSDTGDMNSNALNLARLAIQALPDRAKLRVLHFLVDEVEERIGVPTVEYNDGTVETIPAPPPPPPKCAD